VVDLAPLAGLPRLRDLGLTGALAPDAPALLRDGFPALRRLELTVLDFEAGERVRRARSDVAVSFYVQHVPRGDGIDQGESGKFRVTLALWEVFSAPDEDTATDILERRLRRFDRSLLARLEIDTGSDETVVLADQRVDLESLLAWLDAQRGA
jgi:hypothetical protein